MTSCEPLGIFSKKVQDLILFIVLVSSVFSTTLWLFYQRAKYTSVKYSTFHSIALIIGIPQVILVAHNLMWMCGSKYEQGLIVSWFWFFNSCFATFSNYFLWTWSELWNEFIISELNVIAFELAFILYYGCKLIINAICNRPSTTSQLWETISTHLILQVF